MWRHVTIVANFWILTIFLDRDGHSYCRTMEEKHGLPFCSWVQSCTRTKSYMLIFLVFPALFAGPCTTCWDPEFFATLTTWRNDFSSLFPKAIECFHSRGQHLCKFIGKKESVCIRKEFNSHRTGLGHQHGRCFIVFGHQYGRRDVLWKHSIAIVWLIVCMPFSCIDSSVKVIAFVIWLHGRLRNIREQWASTKPA